MNEQPIVWRVDDVSAEAMFSWVEALRDVNPIHVDPQAASALGYGPRTVNPGPTNLAYVLTMLMAAAPGEYPARIEARFLGNVLSGDNLEVTCDRADDGIFRARLKIAGDGEIVLDAKVTMEPIEE